MISRREKLVRMLDVLDSRLRPIEDELLKVQPILQEFQAIQKLLKDIKEVVVTFDRRFQEHEGHEMEAINRLGERLKKLEGRTIHSNGNGPRKS